MAVMVGVSGIASKIQLPLPVVLLLAGIGVGFIPTMPDIELNPEIIMLLFLPPLLYDAAFNISFKEFKLNLNTISTLAVWLVFATAAEHSCCCPLHDTWHELVAFISWVLCLFGNRCRCCIRHYKGTRSFP